MGEASGKAGPGALLSARRSKTAASQSNRAGGPPSLELGSSLSPHPVDGAGPDIRVHGAGVGVRQVVAHDTAQLMPGEAWYPAWHHL